MHSITWIVVDQSIILVCSFVFVSACDQQVVLASGETELITSPDYPNNTMRQTHCFYDLRTRPATGDIIQIQVLDVTISCNDPNNSLEVYDAFAARPRYLGRVCKGGARTFRSPKDRLYLVYRSDTPRSDATWPHPSQMLTDEGGPRRLAEKDLRDVSIVTVSGGGGGGGGSGTGGGGGGGGGSGGTGGGGGGGGGGGSTGGGGGGGGGGGTSGGGGGGGGGGGTSGGGGGGGGGRSLTGSHGSGSSFKLKVKAIPEFRQCYDHTVKVLLASPVAVEFVSPYFPYEIASTAHCQWLIKAPVGSAVALNIQELSMRGSNQCKNFGLYLYDGKTTYDDDNLGTICDNKSDADLPQLYHSTSNFLLVVFSSNQNILHSGKGVKLQYYSFLLDTNQRTDKLELLLTVVGIFIALACITALLVILRFVVLPAQRRKAARTMTVTSPHSTPSNRFNDTDPPPYRSEDWNSPPIIQETTIRPSGSSATSSIPSAWMFSCPLTWLSCLRSARSSQSLWVTNQQRGSQTLANNGIWFVHDPTRQGSALPVSGLDQRISSDVTGRGFVNMVGLSATNSNEYHELPCLSHARRHCVEIAQQETVPRERVEYADIDGDDGSCAESKGNNSRERSGSVKNVPESDTERESFALHNFEEVGKSPTGLSAQGVKLLNTELSRKVEEGADGSDSEHIRESINREFQREAELALQTDALYVNRSYLTLPRENEARLSRDSGYPDDEDEMEVHKDGDVDARKTIYNNMGEGENMRLPSKKEDIITGCTKEKSGVKRGLEQDFKGVLLTSGGMQIYVNEHDSTTDTENEECIGGTNIVKYEEEVEENLTYGDKEDHVYEQVSELISSQGAANCQKMISGNEKPPSSMSIRDIQEDGTDHVTYMSPSSEPAGKTYDEGRGASCTKVNSGVDKDLENRVNVEMSGLLCEGSLKDKENLIIEEQLKESISEDENLYMNYDQSKDVFYESSSTMSVVVAPKDAERYEVPRSLFQSERN